MARRGFIAGNWKMNKTPDEAKVLAEAVKAALAGVTKADVALCPPFVALHAVGSALKGSPLGLGAQNVHWEKSGAFTGEVSAQMLSACGCRYAIIGHSERRQYFGETDETVNKRLKAALAGNLKPIVCVGELLKERESGVTESVVKRQIEGAFKGLTAAEMAPVTVAYEPVWAIGTGKTATPQQAQEVHAFIRGLLKNLFGAGTAEALRVQYGGSVTAANAQELLSQPDIDGALVGGASLKVEDFAQIVKSAK
jgi:triosephosphate isomerase